MNLERLPRPILEVGVPLLFFAIALGVMPIADALQFDPDEGIELAKVTLYSQGYRLYDQIWNDQPPLLTILLAHWLKLFGANIISARLLTLGFVTVLMAAFHSLLRLIVGVRPALLGAVGLSLTLGFMRLSVSVMRGLPAIGVAMVAVYLLFWATPADHLPRGQSLRPFARKSLAIWPAIGLILSGVCLGLSFQIKFYTVLLLPACLLHLALGWCLQDWRRASPWQRLPTILVWLTACGISTITIGLLTHSFDAQQLLGTHFNESGQAALQREPSWLILLLFLVQDLDYSLLAGVGLWTLLKQNKEWPLFPIVWLGSVVLAFAFYQPLWDHYYPLISIPIVWLATYAITPALARWQQKQTLSRLTLSLMMVAIALVPIKLSIVGVSNHQFIQITQNNAAVIQQVQFFQSKTRWLFTDLPIIAFYAHLKVPPELAVFSTKRLKSSDLSPEKLLNILEFYRPEQVLLGRYPQVKTALEPYLNQHYVEQYQKNEMTQYLLKGVFE